MIPPGGEPQDQSVSLAGEPTFQVSVTSDEPMSLQWRHDEKALAGATNRTLTLINVQPADAGAYDVVVTNTHGSVTSLVARLRIDPSFVQVIHGSLVDDAEPSVSGSWGDYDRDGDLDLFLVNYERTNTLYLNDGLGALTPVDVGSPLIDGKRDLSPSWVDYDNNGFLDLFFVSGNGQPERNRLFRNNLPAVGNTNHWLVVNLDPLSRLHVHPLTLGAKVRVLATIHGSETWQLRQIAANGPFSGGHELLAHFGLGNATEATRVIVEWPSGAATEISQVPADQVLVLRPTRLITAFRGTPDNTLELPSTSLGDSLGLTAPEGDTYQWQRNGNDLPGQTQRTLLLEDCTTDDAGRYSVRVTESGITETLFTDVYIDSQVERMPQGSPPIETPSSSNLAGWCDYDNDGQVDLFVSNRGGPPLWDDGPVQQFLYHNDGAGAFRRMTTAAVGSLATDAFLSGMASWGDYDNDGDPDLLAGSDGTPARLYNNLGNGRFALVEAPNGLNQASTWGLAWADLNRDGWLDVAYASRPVHLFMGSAAGLFAPYPDFASPSTSAEFVTWAHANGDNQIDLYIGDHSGGVLYLNRVPHLLLQQPSLEAGWWGSWGDYDNDGDFDLYAQNALLNNDGNGSFTPADTGLPQTLGAAWGDYDNDGDLDIFLTAIERGIAANSLFLNNGKGYFHAKRLGSLSDTPGNHSTCAWGDYDNDGSLDLYICTVDGEFNQLYRGQPNGNHWLIVKLRGTTSNRSAIGAKITVQTAAEHQSELQARQISSTAWDDLRAHFGLGTATKVDTLTIQWPSGNIQQFSDLTVDQIFEAVEPHLPLLQAVWTEAKTFSMILGAKPGQRCRIDTSENLKTWTAVGVLVGPGQIEELEPAIEGRFYRAVVLE